MTDFWGVSDELFTKQGAGEWSEWYFENHSKYFSYFKLQILYEKFFDTDHMWGDTDVFQGRKWGQRTIGTARKINLFFRSLRTRINYEIAFRSHEFSFAPTPTIKYTIIKYLINCWKFDELLLKRINIFWVSIWARLEMKLFHRRNVSNHFDIFW